MPSCVPSNLGVLVWCQVEVPLDPAHTKECREPEPHPTFHHPSIWELLSPWTKGHSLILMEKPMRHASFFLQMPALAFEGDPGWECVTFLEQTPKHPRQRLKKEKQFTGPSSFFPQAVVCGLCLCHVVLMAVSLSCLPQAMGVSEGPHQARCGSPGDSVSMRAWTESGAGCRISMRNLIESR